MEIEMRKLFVTVVVLSSLLSGCVGFVGGRGGYYGGGGGAYYHHHDWR
jgi:hypothetical protein